MTQPWIEARFSPNVVTTSLEQAINWARQASIWPVTFGVACCAIEMMCAGAGRFDIDRFGAGAFRGSPRQGDLLIIAGTINFKMASRIRRLYDLMPEPKYVIAMGGCAIAGGPYAAHGYNIVNGIDRIIPVDVYVPGCPPRPESLLEALMRLQEKIKGQKMTRQSEPGVGGFFGSPGTKRPDELPLPQHSGCVEVEPCRLAFHHQKVKSEAKKS